MTQHLLRLLGRSDSARIVNVVSSAFVMWKGDPFEHPQAKERYAGIETYARAKLLNLLFTLALARDLAETKITVNAVNPAVAWLARWFHRHAPVAKAAAAGSSLAFSSDAILSGRYFEGKKEKKLPRRLLDRGMQRRAWELGESLVERAIAGMRASAPREQSAPRQWLPSSSHRARASV